ncbi:MarR family winged helix-turn-helix transcriptional regulator [Nocardioides sp. B-3]|uniref:MarR family winged helix-turn-helix transcriptional regulator n=1 Tax=Nocardioides sp. B-3 TaxID=2895565 RepID=UPI0021531894|nr:MarR family transcriptional regulator [Nocardioides sp. B-3]UUZ60439.1 MarR family transcriptional regulator [Nocardioides sp. B-3]
MELPSSLLMFISSRHAEERIVAHLRAHGFDDLTLAQGRLAARVAEGGSRVTELAEAAQITKQTAGFLVNQLEKGGYVERVPDPTDARARLVRMAKRGRAAQACAREMELIVEREWEQRLGVRRMRALRESLENLREITDPYL